MPLIKHYNPKAYIDENGNMYGDVDLRIHQPQPVNPVGSAYWNKYRGNNSAVGDILAQLNRNRKGRNGH